jgi:hypothetical protein
MGGKATEYPNGIAIERNPSISVATRNSGWTPLKSA